MPTSRTELKPRQVKLSAAKTKPACRAVQTRHQTTTAAIIPVLADSVRRIATL